MSNLQEVYARRLSVDGQIDGSGALVDLAHLQFEFRLQVIKEMPQIKVTWTH